MVVAWNRGLYRFIIWKINQIIEFQFKCLKNGLNGIGIPDLIVAQNAKQNHSEIYSLDSHFELMKDIFKLQLTGYSQRNDAIQSGGSSLL